MPKDPREMGCEWCDETASHAVERLKRIKTGFVGTGMYMYACDKHVHLAEADKVIRKR